ncbi:RelA/SpoT family protein [Parapusillimonas granuli]|uniref:GTP pyrophosphokinase n=1 Tax=Parapusillimonas granuli TaxID=380911 RepID=A0A853FZS3_9BURK|nr:bifunctional (p)ppGpp synthetase/guanosine-3',5'-bis(diphosphate) 3'-pyrophosphohydrolase [Parapusillimonas granuli]MBB5216752.1 GTP pyrophosphokinase [Parapusillimonas granuli]MEB2400081.1 bifunctional (p)ppGpp synthetase/guanosine-3',5'-bis(diphosphate) 3'-pyrophosphohydrolase [Alcaligenaceae bacterium]NYT51604.1 bifunctional (p)ppGpp synthetase/guanosine-3',5'-bis(diphosphate) 3'-pyrophosphohydrolase [Parapusillimonas granuli]
MATIVPPDPEKSPFDAQWFERACADLDENGRRLLRDAADWAGEHATGILATTGEPLAQHSAAVVLILAELGTDAQARASALLTVLRPDSSRNERDDPLFKRFGPEVMSLVQGTRALLRLGHLAGQATDQATAGTDQKEMQRKMLLAMAADLRIVLLRLASRLQSLRWHAASKTPCPKSFARETMELYTPLANRLGIWQIKWEMEDLAFRFMEPDTYKTIARQLEEKRVEREAFIGETLERLRTALKEARISADVSGRPKHIYSIWNKMRNKNLAFSQLYDLRALRVIVDDERACYAVLALVHSMWTPVSDEFDDYISRPKPNGYRSLHTVVADAQGRTFEIQIRTHEMHEFAEYGMAAHWRYKEAGPRGGQVAASGGYDQKIAWMRQLLAWDKDEADPSKAPNGPEKNPAGERIYVMTPQARVIELPAGATPVDFAYYLHTDLGHRCRGARVDGQMVPLLTKLATGQTVEIIAAKSGGPSRDWLNPQLGFLASPRSRAKVRAWFNAIELQQRISQGQAMVEKELQRLGKTAVNLEQMAQQLDFACADDLYVAVAKEEFSLRQIDYLLMGGKSRAAEAEPGAESAEARIYGSRDDSVARTGKSGVLVVGVDSLMTQLARCCRPAPPDSIVGFVTRGRGVSIHRRDCSAYAALAARNPERLIDVDWGNTGDAVYPVDISIHAPERPNLLRDLSEVFAKLRLNVVSVNTHSRRSLAHMVFTIEVKSGEQIGKALAALNELSGVTAARH